MLFSVSAWTGSIVVVLSTGAFIGVLIFRVRNYIKEEIERQAK